MKPGVQTNHARSYRGPCFFFGLSLKGSPPLGPPAANRIIVARVRDAPLVPGRMPVLSSRGGSRDLMMAAFAETNITCTHPGAQATSRFESNVLGAAGWVHVVLVVSKIVIIRPRESPGRTLATCTPAERSAAGRGGGGQPGGAADGRVGVAKCNMWDSERKTKSERAAGGRHPGGRKPGGRDPRGGVQIIYVSKRFGARSEM